MKPEYVRAVVLILILLSVPIVGPRIMGMAIVPGPEGLNVELYGVQYGEYSNDLWSLSEIRNNQVLESATYQESLWIPGTLWATHCRSDTSVKCSFPEPRNTVFRKTVVAQVDSGPLHAGGTYSTMLNVERSRPTVSEVNTHGDPLGGTEGPTNIRYIEYHTPTISQGNQIQFTKYCIHVVPADYIIQLSVRGDRALGWSDTLLWFKINTVVWRNAFTQGQVEQIQADLDRNPPENATISAYTYRGGFPIWGWIGEWDPLVWYDEEERETQPPQEALDNIRIYPSLEGREITLYTVPGYETAGDPAPDYVDPENPPDDIPPEDGLPPIEEVEPDLPELPDSKPDLPDQPDPDDPVEDPLPPWDPGYIVPIGPSPEPYLSIMQFGENLQDPQTLENHVVGQIPSLPDPDFAATVYTPLYLERFYPYYTESGIGPWYESHEWYPTVFMRVRLLYAIYGEFVYLWTEQEAEDQGYEWETRYSQYKFTEGPWLALLRGLGAFLVSPYGVLSMLMIMAAIVLIILILVNPGIVMALFKTKGGRRK